MCVSIFLYLTSMLFFLDLFCSVYKLNFRLEVMSTCQSDDMLHKEKKHTRFRLFVLNYTMLKRREWRSKASSRWTAPKLSLSNSHIILQLNWFEGTARLNATHKMSHTFTLTHIHIHLCIHKRRQQQISIQQIKGTQRHTYFCVGKTFSFLLQSLKFIEIYIRMI